MGKGQKDQHSSQLDFENVKEKIPPALENKISPEMTQGDAPITTEMETSRSSAQEALRKLKERREQEPLFYCKLITKYPVRSFCKYFILQFSFACRENRCIR